MQVLNAEDDSVLFSGDATEVTAWNDWKTPTVTFTLEKETIVKLRVAVENKAAGTDQVTIKTAVTDANGKTQYTVTTTAKNLTENAKLKVVAVDQTTGEKTLVNAKTYKVNKDGSIIFDLPAGADYELVSTAEAKTVEKAVLKTVKVKKTSASVKAGKKTSIQLSSKLNMDNVKKVTYISGKKSVATVNKNGKITAKKKGSVTVKAKVTLKNGTTKTVSMKIKVK